MTLTATRVRMLTPVGGLWPALVTGRIEQAPRSVSNQMKMPLASVRVSNRSSPIRRGCSIRRKKWQYSLYIAIFVLSLHPQTERGALVQPVRIRACHARGQGFESPTHRGRTLGGEPQEFFVCAQTVAVMVPMRCGLRLFRIGRSLAKVMMSMTKAAAIV